MSNWRERQAAKLDRKIASVDAELEEDRRERSEAVVLLRCRRQALPWFLWASRTPRVFGLVLGNRAVPR